MKRLSKKGYKKDSPDKNNPYNVIPSGNITMTGVPHNVIGIDNLGNAKMMYPGVESYMFPGNQVLEIPLKQEGGPIQEQRTWLTDYLNSPKYKERLKKEFPSFSEEQINSQLGQRKANLKNAKVEVVDRIGKNPGFIFGDYNNGKIRVENGSLYHPDYNTIPVHELGHAIDAGGKLVSEYTKRILGKNLNKDNPYYSNPTEFINRLQPVRFLLEKEGLYKAGSQDFDSKIFDQMQENPNINRNTHYQDIMNTLNGKTEEEKKNQFIMMMNTIASNNNTSDYPAFMNHGGTINSSEAPQGESTNDFIKNKNNKFFEKIFSKTKNGIVKEEIDNFKKAQMGAQVNLDNPEDPLQTRGDNPSFYGGPYGAYQNQPIPNYVPEYTSQYNFPTVESNTGNPFISQPDQQQAPPVPDYFRRNNNIADLGLAGMQTLNRFFNKKNWKEQDIKNQNRIGIDQTSMTQYGNRGDYDINSGRFRPDQYTVPTYKKGGTIKEYKKGGEYSLNDSEISELLAGGYEFEIID